jgi:hypothetical protein
VVRQELPPDLKAGANRVQASDITMHLEPDSVILHDPSGQPAEVRVVEHLYRALSWEIPAKSTPFRNLDSRTIEFPVTLAADTEKTIAYTAHHTW